MIHDLQWNPSPVAYQQTQPHSQAKHTFALDISRIKDITLRAHPRPAAGRNAHTNAHACALAHAGAADWPMLH